jgi:hypothetical protein
MSGHTNNPNGREKGSMNKNRQVLHDKARDLGVDTFEILLLFAKGDYAALGYEQHQIKTYGENTSYELTISPELRAKCAEKAMEYLYPKLKSVEISTDDDKGGLTIKLAYPDK